MLISALGFQDPASPIMEGIIDLHKSYNVLFGFNIIFCFIYVFSHFTRFL
jgi:hypothetical protein